MIVSTSARALATTSSMRPGWMRPSAMSLVMAIRATSRRTGSKPDRMTVSGVSSMIRSMPVACSSARMLRPSRPMIRPFISSDGRCTTETVCSAVWSAATRWMAVMTMSRALSWASSRALRSMARAILTASCSASSRTASMRMLLASSADMFGDALERGDLLAVGAGEVLAGLVELALAVEELAIALLEHVGALVELLVAGEQAALEAGQLGAPGAGLFLGLALHAELLVLRLEDQLLLAGAGLGLDPARFGGGGLHRLGCPEAAHENAEYGSADGGHDGHRQDEQWFHLCSSHPTERVDRRSSMRVRSVSIARLGRQVRSDAS